MQRYLIVFIASGNCSGHGKLAKTCYFTRAVHLFAHRQLRRGKKNRRSGVWNSFPPTLFPEFGAMWLFHISNNKTWQRKILLDWRSNEVIHSWKYIYFLKKKIELISCWIWMRWVKSRLFSVTSYLQLINIVLKYNGFNIVIILCKYSIAHFEKKITVVKGKLNLGEGNSHM